MAKGLHYIATLDDSDFKKKFADQRRMILDSGKTAQAEALKVETMFKQMGIAAAGYHSAQQVVSFGQDIIRVREERQLLEQSFEVLLQSREKANKMVAEITNLAINSSLEMTPIATAAQILLNLGTNASQVVAILEQLSDVSMGNELRFQSLTMAYAQVLATGSLVEQNLTQMVSAGFNPLTTIADQTGVSVAKLTDEMDRGAISADMIASAFEQATSEGGNFYQTSAMQAGGIASSQAAFDSAIAQMKNSIGTNHEAIINGGDKAVTATARSFEQIGSAIKVIETTYGAYRAALIVTNAAETLNMMVLRQAVIEKQMAAAAGITLTNAEAIAASRTNLLSAAKMGLVKSIKAVGNALLANPYVIALAAVAGLGYGIYKLVTQTDEATQAQDRLNESVGKFKKQQEESRSEIDRNIAIIKDETETKHNQAKAYDALKKLSPELVNAYSLEELKTTKLIDANKKLNEERDKQDYANLLGNVDKAQKAISMLEESYKEASKSPNSGAMLMMLSSKLKDAQADLNAANNAVGEYKRIQKAAEDSAKPIEVKLVEAKVDLDKIKGEFASAEKAINEERERIKSQGFGVIPIIVQMNYSGAQKAVKDGEDKVSDLDSKSKKVSLAHLATEIRAEQKKLASLQNAAISDISKVDDVKASIAALDGLLGTYKTITGEEWGAADKERAKSQQETSDAELAATKALYDAETELKRKQITDKIALMEFDRDETLKRLEEQAQAEEKAKHPEAAKTIRKQKVVVEQSMQVGIDAEKADQLKTEQDRFKNTLDQYKSYTQQREAVEKKFNDDIAEMTKQRTADNGAQIDEAIKIAQDGKKEALKSVNDQEAATMQKTSKLLASLFEDASNKSVSEVLKITATVDKLMSYLSTTETKDITPQFGFTADQLKILKESPKELEAIKGGVEKLNSAAIQKNPFETLIENLKDVFSAGNNDDSTEEKLAKLGTSASASADMIGNIAGEMSGMFEAMGNDELAGAMSTVQGVMSAVSNIGEGFAKGGLIGGIGAAIGEIAKGITALFKASDKRKENEIEQLQEQVDVLQKSYDVLGDSIEKAYSTDAKGLIEDQNKMLEQQNALIKNQIAEEEAKKDTDSERIKEWNARIEENNKLIDENKEKAIDAIFGEDLKSAIDNFATAYADAWASGEDRAQSAKDTVRQMMRQMVTESIKAAIQSSEAMEKIRNKLEEFYADNVLTGWEQDYIYGMAESLQKELDRQFGWADSLMKDEDDPTREAAKRGIATASQESVDENNGRLTAIQMHTSAISGNVTLMQLDIVSVRDSMSTLRDTAVAQLTVMRGIEGNTQSLHRLERIETDMGSMKETLNDIAIKGIKIR